MRIAFTTLGCKVNQYETEIMTRDFSDHGYTVVSDRDEADIYVVNSCTVTATGDKKTRQLLRRQKRLHPNALIVLTGCYPQAFPKEAAAIPEADVITGARDRKGLLNAITEALGGKRVVRIEPHQKREPFEPMQASSFLDRTRAFVKIEDGCDRYCSYCIIPTARGPVRSKPLDALRQELTELAMNGYREIVLVGINLSSYGRELSLRLIDAVETAAEIKGIDRIRLGSLEPELLTREDLLRMADIPQFCPQFHLSLQSGCDETLRRMRRHYTAAEYAEIVSMIREIFPNPAITTDIMVGFPAETEEEFAASLAFVKAIGFARAHIFPYSARSGTVAAKMPNQCEPEVKTRRCREMIAATDRTTAAFLESQIGLLEEVLPEAKTPDGYEGYTKNYTPVVLKTDRPVSGRTVMARLTEVRNGKCVCVPA